MMKNLAKFLFSIVAIAAFTGCASTPSDVIPYPSDVCIVTDNKLGSMGDPVVKIYGNREIKFCCRPCVKKFEAKQEHFMAKLPK